MLQLQIIIQVFFKRKMQHDVLSSFVTSVSLTFILLVFLNV